MATSATAKTAKRFSSLFFSKDEPASAPPMIPPPPPPVPPHDFAPRAHEMTAGDLYQNFAPPPFNPLQDYSLLPFAPPENLSRGQSSVANTSQRPVSKESSSKSKSRPNTPLLTIPKTDPRISSQSSTSTDGKTKRRSWLSRTPQTTAASFTNPNRDPLQAWIAGLDNLEEPIPYDLSPLANGERVSGPERNCG